MQSSHVNAGEGAGEANMTLSLPSAKLSAALASLGAARAGARGEPNAAGHHQYLRCGRQRLSDATAERQALLRALAKASTEGQIDSLRERLAQNRVAIAQAASALRAVSQQASTAEVEVTVVGEAARAAKG